MTEKNDNQIVTHYGLHETPDGVKYLHQHGKSYNFVGVQAPSPFRVQLETKWPCPHMINANAPFPDRVHWSIFMEMYRDDFVRKFLPLPRHRQDSIPFLSDPNNDKQMLLLLLSRLSSPIYPVVEHFERFNVERWTRDLRATNLCPLVLTGIKTHNQKAMEELASAALRSPRRLILVGDPMMVVRPPMERIQTLVEDLEQEKIYSLPLENLGAVMLRRFCRGEQLDAPWVKKETK
jgi:hypothetical protein